MGVFVFIVSAVTRGSIWCVAVRVCDQNEAELRTLEEEHQRMLAEEARLAEERMRRQREKLEAEQERMKQERLREAGRLDEEERDRIMQEFEQNRARIEAAVTLERSRQMDRTRARLERRRAKQRAARQQELERRLLEEEAKAKAASAKDDADDMRKMDMKRLQSSVRVVMSKTKTAVPGKGHLRTQSSFVEGVAIELMKVASIRSNPLSLPNAPRRGVAALASLGVVAGDAAPSSAPSAVSARGDGAGAGAGAPALTPRFARARTTPRRSGASSVSGGSTPRGIALGAGVAASGSATLTHHQHHHHHHHHKHHHAHAGAAAAAGSAQLEALQARLGGIERLIAELTTSMTAQAASPAAAAAVAATAAAGVSADGAQAAGTAALPPQSRRITPSGRRAMPRLALLPEEAAGAVAVGAVVEAPAASLSVRGQVRLQFAASLLETLGVGRGADDAVRVTLLPASSLPVAPPCSNPNMQAFHWDPTTRKLFVRTQAFDDAGTLSSLLVHTVAHILADPRDVSDDASPAFLQQFTRLLQLCGQEMFRHQQHDDGHARSATPPALQSRSVSVSPIGDVRLRSPPVALSLSPRAPGAVASRPPLQSTRSSMSVVAQPPLSASAAATRHAPLVRAVTERRVSSRAERAERAQSPAVVSASAALRSPVTLEPHNPLASLDAPVMMWDVGSLSEYLSHVRSFASDKRQGVQVRACRECACVCCGDGAGAGAGG
jgi:hypothetical protein